MPKKLSQKQISKRKKPSRRQRRKVFLATGNKGKIREFFSALKNLKIDFLTLDNLSADIKPCEEDGATFAENAVKKATYYSKFFPYLTLAEDSGLEVQFLEGAPGIFSSRFGGVHISYREKNRMILHLLKNVSDEARTARFMCAVAVARKGKSLAVFEGSVEGTIARKIRGSEGFGYDPIFYVKEIGKTFGEVSLKIKSRYSHRGKALRKLKEYLTKKFGEKT